jgi:hypothetical protein
VAVDYRSSNAACARVRDRFLSRTRRLIRPLGVAALSGPFCAGGHALNTSVGAPITVRLYFGDQLHGAFGLNEVANLLHVFGFDFDLLADELLQLRISGNTRKKILVGVKRLLLDV